MSENALPEGGVEPVIDNATPLEPVSAAPEPAKSDLGLTGELAEVASLSKFKDVESLAQSYVELESNLGHSIRIPGESATDEMRQEFLDRLTQTAPELMFKPDPDNPEQMEAFRRTVGMPSKPEEYKIPEFENAPEGLDMSEAERFKQLAHEAGLSNDQYQMIVKGVTDTNIDANRELMGEYSAQVEGLKAEWGHAYSDKYKAATQIAAKTKAPAEVLESLKAGYPNVEILRWLDNLAQQFGPEGGNLSTQGGGARDGAMTPQEAQARLDEMMNNKEHPLWDSHHPDHQRAVDERLKLQIAISPKASTSLDQLRA